MNSIYTWLAQSISANEVGIEVVRADQASLNAGLNQVYFWAGVIAVIVIIIAGFFYVTSTGEPAKTKRAKDAILYAVVGLVVIMMAFVITGIIIGGVSR